MRALAATVQALERDQLASIRSVAQRFVHADAWGSPDVFHRVAVIGVVPGAKMFRTPPIGMAMARAACPRPARGQ